MTRQRTRAPRVARPRRPARSRTGPAERGRAVAELRALAHPLRLRLLEAFAGEARTTMQVAAELGEPPTRLYHHVNALERAGILTLARTRQVRGTTEKYFELARKRFGVVQGSKLAGALRAPLRGLAMMVFDEAKADLGAALARAGAFKAGSAPIAFRMLLTLSPEKIQRARRQLMAALREIQKSCKGDEAPAPDALRWALTVAFAPRAGGKK